MSNDVCLMTSQQVKLAAGVSSGPSGGLGWLFGWPARLLVHLGALLFAFSLAKELAALFTGFHLQLH